MIKTSQQLKALIRNLSKEKSADAQILIRNYMMERLLERISKSEYKDQFILKGGMLVASMVGMDARSTMDMDTTLKGATVSIEHIEKMIDKIIAVQIEDGVKFHVKKIQEIMDEAEYPGIRVNIESYFDGVITPLKIDISTGDAITPCEVKYRFHLLLEDRFIEVWAYNLETVFAEKVETIITRDITNTRMRDFYDIHVLYRLYEDQIDPLTLHDALIATSKKRESIQLLKQAEDVFNEIEQSSIMQNLWASYQKKFTYAKEYDWSRIMVSIRNIYRLMK